LPGLRKKYGESKLKIEEEPKEESTLHDERQNILWAIAELEDQLDSGKISPEVHEEKRWILKEKALEVTKTLERIKE
jgi:hypothetical protein